MNQKISFSDPNAFKTLDREQINQIIDAILAGKYSWACFLLLRCIGYEPLHYIPYRTYNRLVKEHCQTSRLTELEAKSTSVNKRTSQIQDLEYLEAVERQNSCIRGGTAWEPPAELNGNKLNSILQQLQHFFASNR
jgi:hypothetical protein